MPSCSLQVVEVPPLRHDLQHSTKGEQGVPPNGPSAIHSHSILHPITPVGGLNRSANMKCFTIAHLALIGITLLSQANAQGRRSIDARVTGWRVNISYSDIDRLPSRSTPVTTVKLSHPSINLRAEMEVPFESFFALWEHLALTSDAELVATPIELPADKDGAILIEKDESRGVYKAVTSDNAVLLIRFWLDTFRHRWVDDSSALTDKESKGKGAFGYLLRHNAFPTKGNALAKFTEIYAAEPQR